MTYFVIQFIFGLLVFYDYMFKEQHSDWYHTLTWFAQVKLYFRASLELIDIFMDLIYCFYSPHLTWWIATLLSLATFFPVFYSIYSCYEWEKDKFRWRNLWDIHMGNYNENILKLRLNKYFYSGICYNIIHTIIYNYENLFIGYTWNISLAIFPIIGLFNIERSVGAFAGASSSIKYNVKRK